MMKCPKCGLYNPDEAIKCDCGYDFTKNDALKDMEVNIKGQKKVMFGMLIALAVEIIALFIIYSFSETFAKPLMFVIAFNIVGIVYAVTKFVKMKF